MQNQAKEAPRFASRAGVRYLRVPTKPPRYGSSSSVGNSQLGRSVPVFSVVLTSSFLCSELVYLGTGRSQVLLQRLCPPNRTKESRVDVS